MWCKTHSMSFEAVRPEQVWKVWSDVNQWHAWQPDIEYARLDGEFATGKTFRFRPKGGPELGIELTEVKPLAGYADLTRFPGARMLDAHEIVDHCDRIEIKNTLTVTGPLGFLWRKLVAEGVAASIEDQTRRMIERARHV
ncbi:MAG TPA: SRPBCC family protein [Gammaproteobacteria bacterium]